MMKLSVFFFALLFVLPVSSTFEEFLEEYGKSYSPSELEVRRSIYHHNLRLIDDHNSQNLGYKLGMNQFGDLTNEEFRKLLKNSQQQTSPLSIDDSSITLRDLPTAWNWVAKGAVTGVSDQGSCGSSAVYAIVGAIEGCHAVTVGELVSLSEAMVVDCFPDNAGCNGGIASNIWKDILDWCKAGKGIAEESCYPNPPGGSCHYSAGCCGSNITSYTNVPSGSESALQQAVYKTPVSVEVDASKTSFQFYSSGVYYDSTCSSTMVDHDMLAVGWGVESSQDYWLVKNSWGTGW
eukprot:CAMPEP_0174259720 /NCGR_PEP_ID=MMETSP0439-20130205/8514_1 /TAXON_ID=0 /ORGANISM="Stereomyxa ramosa, Strain Chinc5" /LENGTH=291 /DNA_ID=CAMNT_0015343725 /DNA_START=44 /DNA_END=916 /DNA_ORIENTATION=-